MLLEGMFLPLTTPFHPDGRLFLRKLQSNVARYSLTPVGGVVVLGGGGEGGGLTEGECREALGAAIGAAGEEKVMVAAVGRESVAATLGLAEVAAEAGYDAVSVSAPTLDPAMRVELMTYFRVVADRSPLPVIVGGVRAEMMGELAGHPNVVGGVMRSAEGVREVLARTAGVTREVTVTPVFGAVTGRMRRRMQATEGLVSAEMLGGGGTALAVGLPVARVRTRSKRVGFQVLLEGTGGMLEAWAAGASGAVPRLAACAPQGCCEVWQAYKDGDLALAEEKLARVSTVGELMEGSRGIAALKYGCDLNGYFGGRPRLPLLMLTAEQRLEVERGLAELRN